MALVRWSPKSELESPWRGPFFRSFFDLLDDIEGVSADRTWHPSLDLVEEKDSLVAHVELPGVDPHNVHINLQGDVLTIQGERKQDQEAKQGKFLRREHLYGSFVRSVQLPYRVQGDKVKAQYRNGVMTITLPKAEEHVGRQIPVEIAK